MGIFSSPRRSRIKEVLDPWRAVKQRRQFAIAGRPQLGRVDPDNVHELFCLTVLALKLSRRANAVSLLHGRVSRNMWTRLWPDRCEDEAPLGHITHGVHLLSWLAPRIRQLYLYDRHLPPDWYSRTGEAL